MPYSIHNTHAIAKICISKKEVLKSHWSPAMQKWVLIKVEWIKSSQNALSDTCKGFAFITISHVPLPLPWSIYLCPSPLRCSQIVSISKSPKLSGMSSRTSLSHTLCAPSASATQNLLHVLPWICTQILWVQKENHSWAPSASVHATPNSQRERKNAVWSLPLPTLASPQNENWPAPWWEHDCDSLLSKGSPCNILTWHFSACLSS